MKTNQTQSLFKNLKIPTAGIICGIDEAGRGTLAGSLFVAGVILEREISGLKDSKKLSRTTRYKIYDEIAKNSTFHIVASSAEKIDSLGLSRCIADSLLEICDTLYATKYIFDGNSTFGVSNITTLIRGDALLASISAASIIAKVAKDREMEELNKLYPMYGFASHCGYGTRAHIANIVEFGLSPVHRKSFKIKSCKLDSTILNIG